MRYDLSPAHHHDIKYLQDIQDEVSNCVLVGDKGYRSNPLRRLGIIENQRAISSEHGTFLSRRRFTGDGSPDFKAMVFATKVPSFENKKHGFNNSLKHPSSPNVFHSREPRAPLFPTPHRPAMLGLWLRGQTPVQQGGGTIIPGSESLRSPLPR